MSNEIDARGQNCPIPVIMAKKEIDTGCSAFTIHVDNHTAVQNLERLAVNEGFDTSLRGDGKCFTLFFTKKGSAVPASVPAVSAAETSPVPSGSGWSVFVGHDIIGDGDRELGTNLIRMYFYTLAQSTDVPASILFMNAGVRLPVHDEQIVEHLRVLKEKGTEILVCGTCLNFYQLTEQLKIGTISNMYDITECMHAAAKVITL